MRHCSTSACLSVIATVGCAAATSAPPLPLAEPRLEAQSSGTTQLLQAVSVVDSMVVWVSGHGGTWGRTTDGGRSWTTAVVAGAETMQFRDVHAESAATAWLLAAGTGDLSRIYHTSDGGRTWTRQWINEEPEGFYDCMDFWDQRRGFVYGDAVGGELRILVTDDGGRSWTLVPDGALPQAQAGEGGFAASGTCAIAGADGRGWVAAGNAPRARVFITPDFGRTWTASDVPVVSGDGAGLTSISMVDERRGTAFGGNLGQAGLRTDNVARTEDGGRTWSLLGRPAMAGPIYGGLHVPGSDLVVLMAVGPGGADFSNDGGRTWRTLDPQAWWGVGSDGPDATWIGGPGGRIARVRLTR
jgi:photosystem II stability/assembly factor-like uncharacterized protein